jgi:signal peptidase II
MQAARGASLSHSDPAQIPEPTDRSRRRLGPFVLVAVLGYAADLGTKELALAKLEPATPVPVVGDVLSLFLTSNSGAAFSLGTSYTVVLSCIAILAVLGTLWYARRLGSTGWALALGFLLAGVLGNLTDRLFRAPGVLRGHVIDFLQLPNFPVFNVADICINVAAGLIILQTVRGIRLDGSRETSRRDARDAKPDL